jgi:hypothetical protein
MGWRYSFCKTQSLSRVENTLVSGKSEHIIHRFEKQSWSHSTIINRVKCQPSRNACALGTGPTRAVNFAQHQKPLLTATSKLPCYQANRKTNFHSFCIKRFCKEQMHHTLSRWTEKLGGGEGRQQVTIVGANRVTWPQAAIARRRLKQVKGWTNFRKNFQYHISQKPVRPSSGCYKHTGTDGRTEGDGDILKVPCLDTKAQKFLQLCLHFPKHLPVDIIN